MRSLPGCGPIRDLHGQSTQGRERITPNDAALALFLNLAPHGHAVIANGVVANDFTIVVAAF